MGRTLNWSLVAASYFAGLEVPKQKIFENFCLQTLKNKGFIGIFASEHLCNQCSIDFRSGMALKTRGLQRNETLPATKRTWSANAGHPSNCQTPIYIGRGYDSKGVIVWYDDCSPSIFDTKLSMENGRRQGGPPRPVRVPLEVEPDAII